MQFNTVFSVGDYELNDRAEFARTFVAKAAGSTGRSAIVNTPMALPAAGQTGRLGDTKRAIGVQASRVRSTAKNVASATKDTVGKGFRKAHIKNIGGKAVMVGQSILKAGKNTAGSLTAAVKANPGKAGAIGAGVAAVGAGAGYIGTRKKRQRR